ncbi:MAG: DoxX family protein [Corynebacterium sp.]|nr:DoxX family protein [Corynebacterium sp.]
MDQPFIRDAALLLLRLILGAVFIAHGLQKFIIHGIDDTAQQFSSWGIPQPRLFVWFAGLGEVVGGAMLIIGLLTTLAAGVLAVEMIAAIVMVHLPNGVFVADGGVEYALVLLISLLMIVVFGSGRASLDEVFSRVEL